MTDDLARWVRDQIVDDRARAAHVHDCGCRSILTRLGTLRPHADCDCQRPRDEVARCDALLRLVDDLADQRLRILAAAWRRRDGYRADWRPA